MSKLFIFDLDGTLTDTLASIQLCGNIAMAKVGFPPYEADAYRYFAGDGARELVRKCLIRAGDSAASRLEEALAEYQAAYVEHCMYKVKPYEGIMELLAALKKQGVRLAVNSNKPHGRAEDVIREIFGKDYFDLVLGQSEERAVKPSPAGVFHIIRELGADTKDVVYLGDTDAGMQTGKNAGVFTIGVLWGFRGREELEECGADVIISHPVQALEYAYSKF